MSVRDDVNSSEKLLLLHKPALGAAVQALLARNRRHATVRNVIAKLRQRGNLDAAVWAETLQKHELAAVINTLWDVHGVINNGAVDEPTIIPATLGWPPECRSGDCDPRRWGRRAAPWVRRSRVLIHTAAQCRDAVTDLRARSFVSVVVDASPRHDLGLIHIAALADDHRPARCYTFDVCATPRSEWSGGVHLFDSGRLARFLGDPMIPKAVCGSAPAHDSVAHAATRHLRRPSRPHTLSGAIRDREGGHNLLLRNTIQVLPVCNDNVDTHHVVSVSLKAHMLDVDAWHAAGAAPRGDRWYWLRRPLSARALDNCAERAFSLCVAYDALAAVSAVRGVDGTARPLPMAQPVTDSLLCIAAAQTAAMARWPDHDCHHTRERAETHDVDETHDKLVVRRPLDTTEVAARTLCIDAADKDHVAIDARARGDDAHLVGAACTHRATAFYEEEPFGNGGDTGILDANGNGIGDGGDDGASHGHVQENGGDCGGGGDDSEKDWEDLCRAVNMYTSAGAESHMSDGDETAGGSDSDSVGKDTDEDNDDWYGDGHGTWAVAESDFYEAP
nr:hypothetical protein [Pandoravirus massiliensis]